MQCTCLRIATSSSTQTGADHQVRSRAQRSVLAAELITASTLPPIPLRPPRTVTTPPFLQRPRCCMMHANISARRISLPAPTLSRPLPNLHVANPVHACEYLVRTCSERPAPVAARCELDLASGDRISAESPRSAGSPLGRRTSCCRRHTPRPT